MPAFPSITYKILMDSFSIKPIKPPLITTMNQFNVRMRAKPGYKTAEITQQIIVSNADWATLRAWLTTTITGGAARFTQTVWDGNAFQSARTCQLKEPAVEARTFTPSWMVLPWNLTVYDLV